MQLFTFVSSSFWKDDYGVFVLLRVVGQMVKLFGGGVRVSGSVYRQILFVICLVEMLCYVGGSRLVRWYRYKWIISESFVFRYRVG